MEASLNLEVKKRLETRKRRIANYSRQCQNFLETRSTKMVLPEYLAFRLLQRQFEGGSVPGLPSAVQAARFLVRQWKRFPLRKGSPARAPGQTRGKANGTP